MRNQPGKGGVRCIRVPDSGSFELLAGFHNCFFYKLVTLLTGYET